MVSDGPVAAVPEVISVYSDRLGRDGIDNTLPGLLINNRLIARNIG